MNKNQSWIFDHSLNIGLLSELRLLQAFRSSEQNVLCFLLSQFLAMKLGLKLMEKENYGQVYIHISIRNTPFKAWHLLIVITNTTIFCNIPSLSMDHTFQVLLWFFFLFRFYRRTFDGLILTWGTTTPPLVSLTHRRNFTIHFPSCFHYHNHDHHH